MLKPKFLFSSASVDQSTNRIFQNTNLYSNSLPNGTSHNTSSSAPRQEDEDEDIKKAIELSLKEAESSRNFGSSQRSTKKAAEPIKKKVESRPNT